MAKIIYKVVVTYEVEDPKTEWYLDGAKTLEEMAKLDSNNDSMYDVMIESGKWGDITYEIVE